MRAAAEARARMRRPRRSRAERLLAAGLRERGTVLGSVTSGAEEEP